MTIVDEAVDWDELEASINARRVAPLDELVPQSEPWLQARTLGIGGSDAAAVCGLGEFKSAFECWLDKSGKHPDGLSIPDNRAMKWGRLLEDAVAAENAARMGTTHIKPAWLYQHRDLDWMLANPDRIAIDPCRPDPGIVEIKTCGPWMADRWGEDGSDSPATYALFQAVHYMVVLDLRWADIAVLISGQEDRHYRIERDDEFVKMLVTYEADFWDRVLRKDPPDPTGAAGDKDLLQRLFDAVPGKELLVGQEVVDLAQEYDQFRKIEQEAEKHKEEAGNRLRLLMGDAEIGIDVSNRVVCTWREHETTYFDQKEFEADMPRFSEKYKHKRPQRPLHVPKVMKVRKS
jgi:putative phage-type endonuclease